MYREKKEYWDNKNLFSHNKFKNNKLHGNQKYYYENGKLNISLNYKNGMKNGSQYVHCSYNNEDAGNYYKCYNDKIEGIVIINHII